jgi:sec-independent protein translocase protein TatB
MFDLGWGKLVLIGIVALIVIGPKELPGALRTLGQWMSKVRRMASEFQNQFHEAMREAELADLKKDVDEMAAKAQSFTNLDPIDDLRKEIESAAAPPAELDAPLSNPASSATSDTPEPAVGQDVAAVTSAEPAAAHGVAEPVPSPPAEAHAAEPPASTGTPDTGRAA